LTSGCQQVAWRIKKMIGRTASSINSRSTRQNSSLRFAGSLRGLSVDTLRDYNGRCSCAVSGRNSSRRTACRVHRPHCPRD
jgi:hypothetical protein